MQYKPDKCHSFITILYYLPGSIHIKISTFVKPICNTWKTHDRVGIGSYHTLFIAILSRKKLRGNFRFVLSFVTIVLVLGCIPRRNKCKSFCEGMLDYRRKAVREFINHRCRYCRKVLRYQKILLNFIKTQHAE